MKLYIVPTTHVQQYWHLAKEYLDKALEKGEGEFTNDQLKLMVTQGQQQLLLSMDKDKCLNAATVQWISYPNERIAYVTYAGGTKLAEVFDEFNGWVKSSGGTAIQCSTGHKGLVRLFQKLNYKKKYTLMELKL